jgi:PAS domain S-box-containing protein
VPIVEDSEHDPELEIRDLHAQLQRRMEALAATEGQLRSFFDLSPIGKAITGLDGRFLRVNKALCAMLGYTSEELSGMTLRSIVHPDDIEDTEASIRSLLAGAVDSLNLKTRHLTRDGRVVWWNVRATARRDASGSPIEIMGNVVDITEKIRTEEEVLRSNAELELRVEERTAELEDAYRGLEAFSYSVSHDLRAPLRAIEGFASIVKADHAEHLDTEGLRLLDQIHTNALRGSRLIDDLLTLSRAARGALHRTPVAMTAMARAAFEEVAADPGAPAGIDFRLGELPGADGDQGLLDQVWINLLSNAVKYSARVERPVIEVEGAVEGELAVYRVRDNGAGFDMAYADKLFGVFQRLHEVSDFEGTGVGLALVQQIVTRHGGRVWAEGAVGKGATFSFSLPVNARSDTSTSWKKFVLPPRAANSY